jgi:hypothetical protein
MLRLKLADITRIPAYLSRNKSNVRLVASQMMERHLRDCQCPAGLGEVLSPDDFSLTFMVASLTPRGMQLHPFRRNEGPLGYCAFPGLVEPVFLRHMEDGTNDYAYVINVYVHLLEAGKRRCALSQRNQIEARRAVEGSFQPSKKSRMSQGNRGTFPDSTLLALTEKVDTLVAKSNNPPPAPHYPALPPPEWVVDQPLPRMPDA